MKLIPGFRLHEKWEIKLLGKSLVEVDRFIDNPYKEIDIDLLHEILVKMNKKESFDYYLKRMRGHDPWRHCGAIFFLYIHEKFGIDGLEAAYLHILLDLFAMNVTSIASADLVTFREIID